MEKKARMGRDPLEGVIDAMTRKTPKAKRGGIVPKRKGWTPRAPSPAAKEAHEAKTFLLRPDQVDRLQAAARKGRVTLSRLMRDLLDGKVKI